MTTIPKHHRTTRFPIKALAVGCAFEAVVLVSALWFDRVLAWLSSLPYASNIEQVYVALVATWADGCFDTTMGYHHFGSHVLVFAFAFGFAGIGVWQRRSSGYALMLLLTWIGLLEPSSRLTAIRYFVPYCDSLGYQLDVQQAHVALLAVSLPSAAAVAILLLPSTRRTFGKLQSNWGQFTLSSMATATAIFAVLFNHMLSLSQVYGRS